MSTFNGMVEGFPYIQSAQDTHDPVYVNKVAKRSVDYFRQSTKREPPLACFLSHVHCDHLQGLESFRAPFIYCSAATRELLLQIERYPHRMNFNRGILESRKLHYKHLYRLLRPIPLNVPTEIELTPRLSIRVTLLDANHCAGAVMFLIEGNGRAVLYTGDIRAEAWWVDSLIRQPALIPYTFGNKQLDMLYLDTTFARASNIYREFPSKAEGLAELLQKIGMYPDDTVFYFRAWTFGYEEVWRTLSATLNTKIHVDRYQMGLYRSLSEYARGGNSEGAAIYGFELGNQFVAGRFSNDEKSRIHSCERGTRCAAMESDKIVYILPIINRTGDGFEVCETDSNGEGSDLCRIYELELPDRSTLEDLEMLCLEHVRDSESVSQIKKALHEAFYKKKSLSLDRYGIRDSHDITLETFVSIPHRYQLTDQVVDDRSVPVRNELDPHLPRVIRFPYSRHSSYTELRNMVSALRPKDIYPCTVDSAAWSEDVSMERLFGDLCAGNRFSHDAYMRTLRKNSGPQLREKACYSGKRSVQSTPQPSVIYMHETAVSFMGSSPGNIVSRLSDSEQTNNPEGRQQSYGESSTVLPLATPQIESISTSLSASPLQVPELTPVSEIMKRNNIRQAWKYLMNRSIATTPRLLVEPLPPSFSVGEKESSVHMNDLQHDLHVFSRQQSKTANPVRAIKRLVSSHAELSVSQERETVSNFESQASGTDGLYAVSSVPNRHMQQVDFGSSRRRQEAYLAAMADTYDAWSTVCLLSAGNNHTEEEIEL